MSSRQIVYSTSLSHTGGLTKKESGKIDVAEVWVGGVRKIESRYLEKYPGVVRALDTRVNVYMAVCGPSLAPPFQIKKKTLTQQHKNGERGLSASTDCGAEWSLCQGLASVVV